MGLGNRPVADKWGWRDRLIVAVILAALLFLLWQLARVDAAPLAGGGVGTCYGASYPATVASITATAWPGLRLVSVTSDAGSYSLYTTHYFRAGQQVTLQGLVCDGSLSASRLTGGR